VKDSDKADAQYASVQQAFGKLIAARLILRGVITRTSIDMGLGRTSSRFAQRSRIYERQCGRRDREVLDMEVRIAGRLKKQVVSFLVCRSIDEELCAGCDCGRQ
jgi:hypothetical protein